MSRQKNPEYRPDNETGGRAAERVLPTLSANDGMYCDPSSVPADCTNHSIAATFVVHSYPLVVLNDSDCAYSQICFLMSNECGSCTLLTDSDLFDRSNRI